MTPKERADEIFQQMFNFTPIQESIERMKLSAKYCAIQAAKEVLYALQLPPIENKGHALYDASVDYWKQVEVELRSL